MLYNSFDRGQAALRARPKLESAKTNARTLVQRSLDSIQFRFDAFPALLYQPLPWLGKNTSGRAEGTLARWQAIEPLIDELDLETAVDIGCQAGFFTISLGERGVAAMGVDVDKRSLRMAERATLAAGLHNVGWNYLNVTNHTVGLVPRADAVLALSVWHHWVWAHGLDGASELLAELWDRTEKVLIFETGEAEMPPEFRLPDMGADAGHWIATYLADNCAGSKVETLGEFKAFGVGGDEMNNVAYRHLFAVTRS